MVPIGEVSNLCRYLQVVKQAISSPIVFGSIWDAKHTGLEGLNVPGLHLSVAVAAEEDLRFGQAIVALTPSMAGELKLAAKGLDSWYRSAVATFRRLNAMPPEGCTRAGILSACPSLDRGSREAEIGFEPRTFRPFAASQDEICPDRPAVSIGRYTEPHSIKQTDRHNEVACNWNMRRPGAAHSIAWKHHKREIHPTRDTIYIDPRSGSENFVNNRMLTVWRDFGILQSRFLPVQEASLCRKAEEHRTVVSSLSVPASRIPVGFEPVTKPSGHEWLISDVSDSRSAKLHCYPVSCS
ncbi:hypothetical protein CLF_110324 [Clonorchis sinensis]|uniref:FHA domain-containing protein n=1 Tax=Clonorchis sinensis TaxID=79923 RepID=G7YKJ3_CLOSI|nr:hypothetical protein CLF_110324 [Clonorchis sinensis]